MTDTKNSVPQTSAGPMLDELLPCPFCGGSAVEKWAGSSTSHFVRCTQCGAQSAINVASHGGSARDDWNRRVATPAPQVNVAAMVVELTDQELQDLRKLIDNAPPCKLEVLPAPQTHVAFKQLEWTEDGPYLKSRLGDREYLLNITSDGVTWAGSTRVYSDRNLSWGGVPNCSFVTLEKAKEAAQADIERRTFSIMVQPPQSTADDIDRCPICADAFKPHDVCATDIEMGIVHAECLDGCDVVDIDTGEPTDKPLSTFPYSEVMDPPPQEHVLGMDDEDRTPVPEGFDAAQWQKADEVHHAMALVASDTECVKILYAALSVKTEHSVPSSASLYRAHYRVMRVPISLNGHMNIIVSSAGMTEFLRKVPDAVDVGGVIAERDPVAEIRRVKEGNGTLLPSPDHQPKSRDGTRRTFVIPDGHYAVLDDDGRATGETRPLPAPAPRAPGEPQP